jgi:hypothetical protein
VGVKDTGGLRMVADARDMSDIGGQLVVYPVAACYLFLRSQPRS